MFNRNRLFTRVEGDPLFSKPVNDLLYRHTAQTPSVEMESMEEMPMNRGTNGRVEDAENYPHDLGHSRERLRAAEAGAKAPTLP